MSKTLANKINSKRAKIAVVGLGYIGLPLAVSFAKKGFSVLGLDKDGDRIDRIKRKTSYILDVPTKDLADVVKNRRLKASTQFELLKSIDVILICVPTPLKRKYTPDISYIVSAVKEIHDHLKKGALIVLESTTYPGTTKELILPLLEASNLKVDRDFSLAFSPERIDPGNKDFHVTQIPKIVGGVTEQSGLLAKKVYEKIIKTVHLVSSAKAAEMTKLLENSFRIINIGWINEVAMMCHSMDIDVWEVIDAAKTKPFGFMPFYPGLGVGGHCIPDDPMYLFWKARHHGFNSKYLKLSADTNTHMTVYAVERLRKILEKNNTFLAQAKVLIVGVTYKKDVKDLRKSPAINLISLLQQKRCEVSYFDPIIPYLNIDGIDLRSIDLTAAGVRRFDCVVIATDHTRVPYNVILKNAKNIFDIRNVYAKQKNKKVVKL